MEDIDQVNAPQPSLDSVLDNEITSYLEQQSSEIEIADIPEDLTNPSRPKKQNVLQLLPFDRFQKSRQSSSEELKNSSDVEVEHHVAQSTSTKRLEENRRQVPLDDGTEASLFPQKIENKLTFRTFWKASFGEAMIFLIKSLLNAATFYRCHLAFFLVLDLIITVIVYFIEDMSFVDTLFTVTSGLTEAGLQIVDLSALRLSSQILIFFTMVIGGQIITTVPLVQFWFVVFLS